VPSGITSLSAEGESVDDHASDGSSYTRSVFRRQSEKDLTFVIRKSDSNTSRTVLEKLMGAGKNRSAVSHPTMGL